MGVHCMDQNKKQGSKCSCNWMLPSWITSGHLFNELIEEKHFTFATKIWRVLLRENPDLFEKKKANCER